MLKKLCGIKAGEKVTFGRYDRVVMDTRENEALLMTDKIFLYRKYDGKKPQSRVGKMRAEGISGRQVF